MAAAFFRVVHGNRLEILAERLADEIILARAGNPLKRVDVVVPHPDMARWLRLWLAKRFGICANVAFPLPASFAAQVLGTLRGNAGAALPYQREALHWRLFQRLAGIDADPRWTVLAQYLANDEDGRRRFGLAGRLAALFERFMVYRADWLLQWERGSLLGLGDSEFWLAELWREITAAIGAPHDALLLRQFLARPDSSGLTDRVLVFGSGHLAPAYLQLLEALSRSVGVVMFLPSPCEHYWGDLVSERELLRLKSKWRLAGTAERGDYYEVGHPLLSSWGKLGRDFLARLHAVETVQEQDDYRPPNTATLLGRIQTSLLTLDATLCNAPATATDLSLGIHGCHSRLREVEVLHDALLAHMQNDSSLRPRDVVVMVPRMVDYSAAIAAVFGSVPKARYLPFRIGDRGAAEQAPLIAAFLNLLDLRHSRFALSEVLGWLAIPALAAAAGLDTGDVKFLKPWLVASGVRFGLDRDFRHASGSGDYEQNTWRFGLDRLLVGYARGAHADPWHGVVGYDEAEGVEVGALGRLNAWLLRLSALREDLARARPIAAWRELAERILEDFLRVEADDGAGRDALVAVRAALAQLTQAAVIGACSGAVPVAVWRDALASMLTETSSASAFPADGVTFCTLHPLRNIPFRVIALLGLNDGEFPRNEARAEFDLMTSHPRPGDRNTRDDDRGLFLDALVAARDVLHLSYVAFSAKQGEALPPAAVVEELLQFLAEQCFEGDRKAALARVLCSHALQPFAARYYDGSAARSFAGEWLPAARASIDTRQAIPVFAAAIGPLPAPSRFDLGDLIAYLQKPARVLLRNRLGIRLQDDDRSADDDAFDLDKLDEYELKELLLQRALLDGDLPAQLPDWLGGLGLLPYGPRGVAIYQAESLAIRVLASQLSGLGAIALPPQTLRMELESFELSATLRGLSSVGLVRYRVGKCRAVDLLDLWLHHLVLSEVDAAGCGAERQLMCVEDRQVEIYRFGDAADARARLIELGRIFQDSHASVLPWFPESALRYARALRRGDSPDSALLAARGQWLAANDHSRGEGDEAYTRLLTRGMQAPLDAVFAGMAEQVFVPLLEALQEP